MSRQTELICDDCRAAIATVYDADHGVLCPQCEKERLYEDD